MNPHQYQWGNEATYQPPQMNLHNGQPWVQYFTEDGTPYWYHQVGGYSVWNMPEEFRQALFLQGPMQNTGDGGYYSYNQINEDYLFEQACRLSLEESSATSTGATMPTPAPVPARTPTPGPSQVREGREKNIFAKLATQNSRASNQYKNPGDPAYGICTRCSTGSGLQRVPCGCTYCYMCVLSMFIDCWESESGPGGYTPPKCCRIAFPTELADAALAAAMAHDGPSDGGSNITSTAASRPSGAAAEVAPVQENFNGKGKGKSREREQLIHECVACMDSFNLRDVMIADCKHNYCRPCMNRLFIESTKSESLYPPSCCKQNIPITWANLVLNTEEQNEFYAKGQEWMTKDRLYCSTKGCSAFIPPMYINNENGACMKCRARTCIHCKGPSHRNACPKDKATQDVLKLAKTAGWRRCYNCRDMVELGQGCNHITCRCGAEFCYTCGEKWHTCNCQLWRDDNLREVIRAQGHPGYAPVAAIQGAAVPGAQHGMPQWVVYNGRHYRMIQREDGQRQNAVQIAPVQHIPVHQGGGMVFHHQTADGRRMMWDAVNGWREY